MLSHPKSSIGLPPVLIRAQSPEGTQAAGGWCVSTTLSMHLSSQVITASGLVLNFGNWSRCWERGEVRQREQVLPSLWGQRDFLDHGAPAGSMECTVLAVQPPLQLQYGRLDNLEISGTKHLDMLDNINKYSSNYISKLKRNLQCAERKNRSWVMESRDGITVQCNLKLLAQAILLPQPPKQKPNKLIH
ncbi:hypothetical protein AAY473_004720 [Plecturocebus cupreus]